MQRLRLSAVVVTATTVFLGLTPAHAHNSPGQWNEYIYRSPSAECVRAKAVYDHSLWEAWTGSDQAYNFFGAYQWACLVSYTRPPGLIKAKMSWWKSGTRCHYTDWAVNTTPSSFVVLEVHEAMDRYCGKGTVTLQSGHFVHNGEMWLGATVNPSGSHHYPPDGDRPWYEVIVP